MSLAASISSARRRLMRRILPQKRHADLGIPMSTSTKFLYRMTLAVKRLSFNIADQRAQDRRLVLERITKRPSEGDVSLDAVGAYGGKVARLAPPGNGRATSAS
jgi:hypothetical protein